MAEKMSTRDRLITAVGELMRGHGYSAVTAKQITAAAFAAAAETIAQNGWINMCPVATVAGEIADSEPALREVAAEVMNSWIDEGTAYFVRRGLAEPEARELILAVVSALEGAFILSRTLRSPEPLLAAGRAVGARMESVLARKPMADR